MALGNSRFKLSHRLYWIESNGQVPTKCHRLFGALTFSQLLHKLSHSSEDQSKQMLACRSLAGETGAKVPRFVYKQLESKGLGKNGPCN